MSASQKPLRSMTGFARVRRTTPHGEFTVNMKSLNHRGLDLHLHLATALEPCEARLREVVKRHVARGYLQATMGFTALCAGNLPALNAALNISPRFGIRPVSGGGGEGRTRPEYIRGSLPDPYGRTF